MVYLRPRAWNVPRTFAEYFEGNHLALSVGPDLRPLFIEVTALPEGTVERLSPYTRSTLGSRATAE